MLDRLLHFVTGNPAFQFLRSVTPFDLLPDGELERVCDALGIEYHPRGSTLFAQGQSVLKDVYVVMKGSLELLDSAPGTTAQPKTLSVGHTYGGACALTDAGIALFTVCASQDTFLYAFPRSLFLEVCAGHPTFHDFFADSLSPRSLERVSATPRQKWLTTPPDPDSVGFGRTAGETCDRDVVWCSCEESIRDVAQRMTVRRCHALLVGDGQGALVGVVSERDLLERALATGLDPARAVSAVMTPVVKPTPAAMCLADAMEVMVRAGVRSLPIADQGGEIVGLLTDADLIVAHGGSPLDYLRDIARTRLRKDLVEKRARLPRLVRALMLDGARIDSLTWFVSAVSDTTLRRLLDMAIGELGPPPVPFVFLTLGSEGRREQTLVTDQDSALVFEDVPGRQEVAAEYFARLGERVCTWLKEIGVEYCEANVMASNPRWCQPLSVVPQRGSRCSSRDRHREPRARHPLAVPLVAQGHVAGSGVRRRQARGDRHGDGAAAVSGSPRVLRCAEHRPRVPQAARRLRGFGRGAVPGALPRRRRVLISSSVLVGGGLSPAGVRRAVSRHQGGFDPRWMMSAAMIRFRRHFRIVRSSGFRVLRASPQAR